MKGSSIKMAGKISKKDHRYNPRLLWLELGPRECREYCPWEINLIRAELLYVTGNWEGAEESYRLNLSWARKDGRDDRIARSETGLGDILQAKGNFTEALQYLNSAYERFEGTGSLADMSHVKGKMGTIQWKQGNHREALELYEIQREMANRAGDILNVSRALGNLGSVHADLADNGKAFEFYQQALDLTRRIGHRRNMAITLCNIGTIHWSQNELTQALDCYQQAMDICKGVGDKRVLGMIYGNLGALYHSLDDNRRALECQNNKITIMGSLGDRLGKCSALDNAADILIQEKEFPLAERYLKEAVATAAELQVEYHLCEYLALLAELYLLTGRSGLCAKTAGEALDIAGRSGRDDVAFKCRLLKIKSSGDEKSQADGYSKLLTGEKDDHCRAELYYQLYRTAGREEDRRQALLLFEKLQDKEPKRLYRERIAELCR